jgi:putative endonuclease
VDRRKRLRLARLAEAWLQAHPEMAGREVRFDVVGLTPGSGGSWAVEHIPGAFDTG